IYESRNSLHPIFSYASDDYYAFLEDQEGDWMESGLGDHTMDLAIGRIPVVTVKDAEIAADKLIRYETGEERFGEWRTRLCFVADDGDGVDGIIHQRDADMLAAYVDTLSAGYSVKKIFVDAYRQELFPSYQVTPEANRDLVEEVNNGLLIINYTGHGNEYQWTSEAILDMSVISNFTNRDHLPLFVTATCEFGRHDDPRIISGAETAIFNERGGAIGLVTTSRPVFSSTNFILNKAFYDHVFEREKDQYLSIGEVFRRTKNESLNGSVNRNFSLLGDPSMVLAYPSRRAGITRINGIDLASGSDTLEAMQLVSVDGEIADANGTRIYDYQGSAIITVFDKPVNKKTLGAQDPVMSFKTRDNILFKGTAGVKNGSFRSEFIVPKNINYQVGDGRIMLYSVNEDQSMDAGGSAAEFKVGGTAEDFPQDQVPPEIRLYLYDSAMAESEVIGTSPVLIARLYDESGISCTSYGLEKGITAKLDDQEFDLSRYYIADRDDYKSGTVNFRFFNLAGGLHNLELTARDTYNNLGKGYIRFTVSDVRNIVIDNLINYPNPFNHETTFSFIHNRAGEDLEISLNIYNMSGELVRELTTIQANSDYKIDGLSWNGASSTGEKLQPGLYAYHVTVRSLTDGAVNRQYQKLIINY
ncbi:MAG TPA: type IX secretion system sortase PorU, partial [Cyclobacteriaceae bacterium]|nr:type IX secretion system sortase PorU [Cyclobacteriaceae bacterium]